MNSQESLNLDRDESGFVSMSGGKDTCAGRRDKEETTINAVFTKIDNFRTKLQHRYLVRVVGTTSSVLPLLSFPHRTTEPLCLTGNHRLNASEYRIKLVSVQDAVLQPHAMVTNHERKLHRRYAREYSNSVSPRPY